MAAKSTSAPILRTFEDQPGESKTADGGRQLSNGEGFPVIEYLVNDQGYHKALAEYLQKAWGELGITMEVKTAEWQA